MHCFISVLRRVPCLPYFWLKQGLPVFLSRQRYIARPGEGLLSRSLGCTRCPCALLWVQVWTEYAVHVTAEGLTPQGLAQLYLDGFANAQQDYEHLEALGRDAGEGGMREQVRRHHGQQKKTPGKTVLPSVKSCQREKGEG